MSDILPAPMPSDVSVNHTASGLELTYRWYTPKFNRLNAATRDNRKIKLVSGIDSHDVAVYLEQEIERYLGIKDLAVRGER